MRGFAAFNGAEMDAYRSFAELGRSEKEDVDFRILTIHKKGSATVIVAPHGGGIEPGTSEVAQEVAGGDFSLALFEGVKPDGGNRRLHLTSTNFDEPRCMELVLGADTVVTIHGEASMEPHVFLGGRNHKLGALLKAALKRHGYAVGIHGNTDLHGLSSENICNRGRSRAGVQLELSRGLRRSFFRSLTGKGRKEPTDALFRFTAAVRQGLLARR